MQSPISHGSESLPFFIFYPTPPRNTTFFLTHKSISQLPRLRFLPLQCVPARRAFCSVFYKVKEPAGYAGSFGEGISLMGCSKNYIMYWGVFTVIIIACSPRKVCTNMDFFCAVFYSFFADKKNLIFSLRNFVQFPRKLPHFFPLRIIFRILLFRFFPFPEEAVHSVPAHNCVPGYLLSLLHNTHR